MIRTSRRRELGQYFTPAPAARFVVDAAAAALGRVPRQALDPACGDGAFLRAVLDARLATRPSLFGIELDPHVADAAGDLRDRVFVGDALGNDLPPAVVEAVRTGIDLVVGNPPFGGGSGAGRLEYRFARRFVELAAPSGAVGLILPHGVLANESAQGLRDSLLATARLVAAVELPGRLFAKAGAAARTFAVILAKKPAAGGDECVMASWTDTDDASRRCGALVDAIRGAASDGVTRVPADALAGRRWDPPFWTGGCARALAAAKVALEPLGRFIEHITYGPIVTGERGPQPPSGDVVVVGLRELCPTGLDLSSARRVARESIHDPPRCRLRDGDIVFARSGAGSLLKGRAAVFDGHVTATVACFVDLVRLRGIDPGYVLLCLKTSLVREQIRTLVNGVGTPNLSFTAIRSLMIPRLGHEFEQSLARREATARTQHADALRAGREPVEAARTLESAVELIDNRVVNGTS